MVLVIKMGMRRGRFGFGAGGRACTGGGQRDDAVGQAGLDLVGHRMTQAIEL